MSAPAASYDVLVVGELNADIILTGDVTPVFGQVEKLVEDLSICVGSSSAIFAVSAARMGLRVLFCSRVGDDLLGHYLCSALSEAGVETEHVTVDPTVKTGATLILSRGVDRAMLTYLGAISAVGPEDLPEGWESLARHLHVASPFLLARLQPHYPALMRRAKQAGMTVSLDTNWDPEERWQMEGLLDNLDVFLPNERELCAIMGEDSLDAAVEAMSARVPVLAVKRGPDGALGVARGRGAVVRVPALPVEVVDTTGAGDTFDGAFLAGWLRGLSLEQCLALGCVAGALTTTQAGGLNGQPTWAEALRAARAHLALYAPG